jgi:putative transposase
MAKKVVAQRGVSIRRACKLFGVSETCYRYEPKCSDDNALIADWLLRLTYTNRHWGFGLCYLHLRNVRGMKYNHKRVYRIYRELELKFTDQATTSAEARPAGSTGRAAADQQGGRPALQDV